MILDFENCVRRSAGMSTRRRIQESTTFFAFTEEIARTCGFAFIGREHYTNEVAFSPQELVYCLTTHCNIIAAVEQGSESISDVYAWLLETAAPLFSSETGTFLFGGEIWFLQPSHSRAPPLSNDSTWSQVVNSQRNNRFIVRPCGSS